MSAHWHSYDTAAVWADAVSAALLAPVSALAADARACLILTGGSTPGPIYTRMAAAPIPWPQLTLLLSDDRRVPADSEHSNLRALRGHFGGLGARIPELTESVAQSVLPACAGLLGMGPDGHVLSWFAEADGYAEALTTHQRTQTINAENAAVAAPIARRISLSLAAVRQCPVWHIAIRGADKRRVAQAALNGADYPVTVLLAQAELDIHFHWCD